MVTKASLWADVNFLQKAVLKATALQRRYTTVTKSAKQAKHSIQHKFNYTSVTYTRKIPEMAKNVTKA